MADNVLGPRVTGEAVYKPDVIAVSVIQAARRQGYVDAARMEAMKKAGTDHVEVEREVYAQKTTGFNIHLAQEGKTIFMPVAEAEDGLSVVDKILLQSNPGRFGIKFARAMIATARKQLAEGTVGKPADLEGYLGEAWMSPEQVAVLVDLRKEYA